MVHPIFSTALDASLGFAQNSLVEQDWSVFPNPATQEVTVQLPASLQGKTICLLDAVGKVQQIQTTTTFDISMLPNGVYFLQCPQTQLRVLKLVVNH